MTGSWQCPGCGVVVSDDVTWGPGESPCDCAPAPFLTQSLRPNFALYDPETHVAVSRGDLKLLVGVWEANVWCDRENGHSRNGDYCREVDAAGARLTAAIDKEQG
jgi:hypothetical protein